MKQLINCRKGKVLLLSGIMLMFCSIAFAQEKVEVNGNDIGDWFKEHWMWVAGGVILLLLIIIASSGSSSRRSKQTTITRDNSGNVKKVTTTEVEDV
jgi:hypothetical protein